MSAPKGDRPHAPCGTPAAYNRHSRLGEVPCGACRAAKTEQARADRARRAATPGLADQAGHGKESTYSNYGCRCDACTAANTAAGRARRAAR